MVFVAEIPKLHLQDEVRVADLNKFADHWADNHEADEDATKGRSDSLEEVCVNAAKIACLQLALPCEV